MTNSAEPTDVLEERLIDAEYKIWKKNTPYLYDFILTHSLEWPSLTCQWLPTVRQLGSHAVEHSLLLGTHTSNDEPNYLMIATCALPKAEAVVDNPPRVDTDDGGDNDTYKNKKDDDNNKNNQRDADIADSDNKKKPKATTTDLHQLSGSTNANTATTTTVLKHTAPKYDEERREMGGFGQASSSVVGRIEIKMKIVHAGEVNRARCMPQNHFIVASRGPSEDIYIFDRSKHPSYPTDPTIFHPQMICCGHTREGYAMSWSPYQMGSLLTGSDDTTCMLWDINVGLSTTTTTTSASSSPTRIVPVNTFRGHTETVEDVAWHGKDHHLVGSVGDDKLIALWDIRQNNNSSTSTATHSQPTQQIPNAHEGDINCIAFNPKNEYIFATGSADKTVAIWDMRNMKTKLHSLVSHADQIYKVEWAPFNESILASCSADRRVALWDLSRIGQEQTPEDQEDGPPELLFLHGGHTSRVSDFDWNSNDEWTMASVSEDNILQVWNLAEEIYATNDDDDDEIKSSGEGEDGLLGDDELE